MANIFGIDMGSRNIKVYSRHGNSIIGEKNTIAVVNKNQLYAYGDDAYSMFEKSPEAIQVFFPVNSGVIANYNQMQAMIIELLESYWRGRVRGSSFVVAVPTDITEVEKKAFYDLFYKSKMKPKRVLLCDKPIADGLGLGLDVTQPTGVMIVDMGADTTEISVVSLGGLVLSELLHFGGSRLDDSIVSFIKKKYNLVIGKRTACQLKEEIGSALPAREGTMKVVGLDVISGLPIEMPILASDVYEAIRDNLASICTSIKMILEKTPPEVSKDIIRDGIYLTGGCARIHGLDRLFTDISGIAVNIPEDPETTVVKGLGILTTGDRYTHLAYGIRPRVFR